MNKSSISLFFILLFAVTCKAQLLKDYATACNSMKETGQYISATNYQTVKGQTFKVCTFKNKVDNDTTLLGFWTENNLCYWIKTISTCEKVKFLKNSFIKKLGMVYSSKFEGYIKESKNVNIFMNTYSLDANKCSIFVYAQ